MKRSKGRNSKYALLLAGDIGIIVFSYVCAFRVRFGELAEFSEIIPLWFFPLLVFVYIAVFYFFDLYEIRKYSPKIDYFIKMFFSIMAAAVLISFLKYGIFLMPIGRGILFIANVYILTFSFLWRALFHRMFAHAIKPVKILLVGNHEKGTDIAREIKMQKDRFEVLGFVDSKEAEGKLSSLIENNNLDQIVLTDIETGELRVSKGILMARSKGVDVINLIDFYQLWSQKIPVDYIDDKWLLNAKGFERSNNIFAMRIKRFTDVCVCSVLLLLSLPLWPIIALMIKINSKGPVFYRQKRVGLNESIFSLRKFRSMIEKAEADEPLWAGENDKRITASGRILRKLHLDEWPQLLNVLKGEMSLVGPRPERPGFVEEFREKIPYYACRHFVKPGITGWAQVNYPYAASEEDSKEKLEYDLYYISNLSLLLDLQILMKTTQLVLGKSQD